MSEYEGVGRVDVVELLNQLDIGNVRAIGRSEVEFSCPFNEGHMFGDGNPSNHMNEDKLVYRCKGCGRAGTVLDLIGYVRRCSPLEALRWLRERFGETPKLEDGEVSKIMQARLERWASDRAGPRVPDEVETIGDGGVFELDWESDHDAATYMRARGFSPELMTEWGFGYDSWTQRVTIPVRDEEGALVGFKGRTIVDHPTRYSILGDVTEGPRPRAPRYGIGYGFDMYDPREVVFGLDRVQSRRLVVCEGELNAFALACAGVDSAVAIGTTKITTAQQRLLRWYADGLVLVYDSDEAGKGATWGFYVEKNEKMIWVPGFVEKLSPYLPITIAPNHEHDPAKMLELDKISELSAMVDQATSWRSIALA